MRKKFILIILLAVLAIITTVWLVVRNNYNLSPDYNYITAKMDISTGHCRIVHVGEASDTTLRKETDSIAAGYGFSNVYLQAVSTKEQKGISRYNQTIDVYLAARNGLNWKRRYRQEIDSLRMKKLPSLAEPSLEHHNP